MDRGLPQDDNSQSQSNLGRLSPDLQDRGSPENQPEPRNAFGGSETNTREGECAEDDNARLREDEPPAKVRKVSKTICGDTDGETCPICLDPWGNSGEHRLVALKCGHLFGAKCVEQWLKAQPANDRACPTCKTKNTMKDIRQIYARKLVAADNSQIITLQKRMDSLQAEKSTVELELQMSRIAHRACLSQLELIRKSHAPKEQAVSKSWRFVLEKNLEVHNGCCRVLTYNCRTCELYVSQKNMDRLFPGYGIRKVSCVSYNLGQFVHLHRKPIMDITYSQSRDLLLSVGLDSSARIVERGIPSVTVQSEIPQLWSCSWDYLRSNEFYVGGVGGVIMQYDVRNPSTYLQRMFAPAGDLTSVVSLCSTEFGLLSCQSNSCWLWLANQRQWEPRAMPVEGPFMSLSYDKESNRALIWCKPKATERSKLALCKLKASVPRSAETEQPNQLDVVVDIEYTFAGSTKCSLMSRAAWVKAPGASWLAAYSQSDPTLCLHGLDGAKTMSLPVLKPVLDVCSVQLNGDTLLAALSDSRLRLYKAVSTYL